MSEAPASNKLHKTLKSILRKQDELDAFCNTSCLEPTPKTESRKPACTTIVRDRIVERPRRCTKPKPRTTNEVHHFRSIEGYIPKISEKPQDENDRNLSVTDHDDVALRNVGDDSNLLVADNKETDEVEPLIFHSLSEMMELAGTLPSSSSLSTATVVEAKLNFSCMDPEEYRLEKEQALAEQTEIMMRNHLTFISDENSDPEDGFFGIFDDSEEDEESSASPAPPPPRAFLKLWSAVAQWVTPEAVQYVVTTTTTTSKCSREKDTLSPVPAKSDIEMSRCSALMSLLKMQLSSSTDSNHTVDLSQRQSLGELLRRFDYRYPSPSLETSMVKALLRILLDMLHPEDDSIMDKVPPVCAAVGLSLDEYRYLVQSSIRNFQQETITTDE